MLILPKSIHPGFSQASWKPYEKVEIDWSNPLTRELRAAWVFTPGNKITDLVSGVTPTSIGGTEPTFNAVGGRYGLAWTSGTSYYDFGHLDKLNFTGPMSINWSCWDDGTNNPDGAVCGNSNANWNYLCHIDAGAEQVIMRIETTDAKYPASSVAGGTDFMHGKWNSICGKYDDSIPHIAVNEFRNTGGSVNLTPGSDRFTIGQRGDNGDQLTNTTVEYLFVHGRFLTDDEDFELRKNPWQLVKPVSPVIYSIPSAAPPGGNQPIYWYHHNHHNMSG